MKLLPINPAPPVTSSVVINDAHCSVEYPAVMQRFGQDFWRQGLFWIGIFWGASSFFWLFHNLSVNPHTDMQLVTYTMQMLQSVQDGNIWEYLMTPRKYPLFPSLILGVLYLGLSGVLLAEGIVDS